MAFLSSLTIGSCEVHLSVEVCNVNLRCFQRASDEHPTYAPIWGDDANVLFWLGE